MCLINFHFQAHPKYKLIVAANRDEFYNRPTAPAHFWEDKPHILAGRDLLQMGTWLGIHKNGQFAALTNYRDPSLPTLDKHSRGEVVTSFLESNDSAINFLQNLHEKSDDYSGFNILVGSGDALFYYSNIEKEIKGIPPGTHGLSNHLLNTPWPKVLKGRKALHNYVNENININPEVLFQLLANADPAEDEILPNTGVGLTLERTLSPLFIKSPDYGTRSSSVLLIDHHNAVTFVERTYVNGQFVADQHFEFQI